MPINCLFSRLLGLPILVGVGLIALVPGSAVADTTGPSPVEIQESTLAAVADQGGATATPVVATRDDFTAAIGDGSVEIPRDSDDAVTASADGTSISLDIPARGTSATRVGGTVVYRGGTDASDLAVQAIPDGVRALVSINDASAPRTYEFPLSGDVARVDQNPDGSLILFDSAGNDLGTVDAPWALDANGNSVPTHFEVDGTTVVQVVDFSSQTAFPVTADPSVHFHWTTVTVELYPLDQVALKNGSYAAAVVVGTALCIELGPGAVICGGTAATAVAILRTYVDRYFHPHCHLNLSFHYSGQFDRAWTSRCA
jgi:hypothetical protein